MRRRCHCGALRAQRRQPVLPRAARASATRRRPSPPTLGPGGAGIPAAVAAALAGELDALPAAARRVLEAAAVAGEPFEPDLVADVADLGEDGHAGGARRAARAGAHPPHRDAAAVRLPASRRPARRLRRRPGRLATASPRPRGGRARAPRRGPGRARPSRRARRPARRPRRHRPARRRRRARVRAGAGERRALPPERPAAAPGRRRPDRTGSSCCRRGPTRCSARASSRRPHAALAEHAGAAPARRVGAARAADLLPGRDRGLVGTPALRAAAPPARGARRGAGRPVTRRLQAADDAGGHSSSTTCDSTASRPSRPKPWPTPAGIGDRRLEHAALGMLALAHAAAGRADQARAPLDRVHRVRRRRRRRRARPLRAGLLRPRLGAGLPRPLRGGAQPAASRGHERPSQRPRLLHPGAAGHPAASADPARPRSPRRSRSERRPSKPPGRRATPGLLLGAHEQLALARQLSGDTDGALRDAREAVRLAAEPRLWRARGRLDARRHPGRQPTRDGHRHHPATPPAARSFRTSFPPSARSSGPRWPRPSCDARDVAAAEQAAARLDAAAAAIGTPLAHALAARTRAAVLLAGDRPDEAATSGGARRGDRARRRSKPRAPARSRASRSPRPATASAASPRSSRPPTSSSASERTACATTPTRELRRLGVRTWRRGPTVARDAEGIDVALAARARGRRARAGRQTQRRHRPRALPQPQDRRKPHPQHLRQTRRQLPRRARHPPPRTRPPNLTRSRRHRPASNRPGRTSRTRSSCRRSWSKKPGKRSPSWRCQPLRAYESDLRHFGAWCERRALE